MKNNQSHEKAIDLEFLRTTIENDAEFERELFKIFLENANRNLLKMEDAIKENDNNSWYMAAHAFKGSSASVGAFNLSEILGYAQKHPEDNLDQKAETLRKVKEEFRLVLDFISAESLGK
jgi:HPt (histidine-containing phosphotransfer) domain-containing protein